MQKLDLSVFVDFYTTKDFYFISLYDPGQINFDKICTESPAGVADLVINQTTDHFFNESTHYDIIWDTSEGQSILKEGKLTQFMGSGWTVDFKTNAPGYKQVRYFGLKLYNKVGDVTTYYKGDLSVLGNQENTHVGFAFYDYWLNTTTTYYAPIALDLQISPHLEYYNVKFKCHDISKQHIFENTAQNNKAVVAKIILKSSQLSTEYSYQLIDYDNVVFTEGNLVGVNPDNEFSIAVVPTKIDYNSQPINFYLKIFSGISVYNGTIIVKAIVNEQAEDPDLTDFVFTDYQFYLLQDMLYYPPIDLDLKISSHLDYYNVKFKCHEIEQQPLFEYMAQSKALDSSRIIVKSDFLAELLWTYQLIDYDNVVFTEGDLVSTNNLGEFSISVVPTKIGYNSQPINFYLKIINGTTVYNDVIIIKALINVSNDDYRTNFTFNDYHFNLLEDVTYYPPIQLFLNVYAFISNRYFISTSTNEPTYSQSCETSKPTMAKLLLNFNNNSLQGYNYTMGNIHTDSPFIDGPLVYNTDHYEIDILPTQALPEMQPQKFWLQFYKNGQFYNGPLTLKADPENLNIIFTPQANYKLFTDYIFTPPSTVIEPYIVYTVILIVILILIVAFYGKFLKSRFYS